MGVSWPLLYRTAGPPAAWKNSSDQNVPEEINEFKGFVGGKCHTSMKGDFVSQGPESCSLRSVVILLLKLLYLEDEEAD